MRVGSIWSGEDVEVEVEIAESLWWECGEIDRINRMQDYRMAEGGVVGLWSGRGCAGRAVVRVWRWMFQRSSWTTGGMLRSELAQMEP